MTVTSDKYANTICIMEWTLVDWSVAGNPHRHKYISALVGSAVIRFREYTSQDVVKLPLLFNYFNTSPSQCVRHEEITMHAVPCSDETSQQSTNAQSATELLNINQHNTCRQGPTTPYS